MEKKQKKSRIPLGVELADMDRALVRLLIKRTRLMQQRSASRKLGSRPKVDPDFEKELWKIWQEALQDQSSQLRNWRILFDLANELAYGQTQRSGPAERFILAPSRFEAAIDSSAPADTELTRLWLLAARLSGSPLRLDPVVLNDPLIECIKALNQLGGGFSWDRTGVASDFQQTEPGHQQPIFIGDDRLNLFLMVCLQSAMSGTVKLTGGMELKRADLRPSREVLRQMGARATFLSPGGSGLPLRLECSGMAENEIRLDRETPREMALALPVSAPAFPNGLVLSWEPEWSGAALIPKGLHVLRACGVEFTLDANRLQIAPSYPDVPQRPEPVIDIFLAAPFLALPGITGGTVKLQGTWPKDQPEAEVLVGLLNGFGCHVLPNATGIVSQQGTPSSERAMDIRGVPRLLPLAAALAVLSPEPSRILVSAQESDLAHCLAFLSDLDQPYRQEEDALVILPYSGPGAQKRLLTSPDPLWSIALSLCAYARSGLELTNPGDMSRLWPRYWACYRNLPNPGSLTQTPVRPDDSAHPSSNGGRKGRRYVVD